MKLVFKGDCVGEIKSQMRDFLGLDEPAKVNAQPELPLEEKEQPVKRGRKPKSVEADAKDESVKPVEAKEVVNPSPTPTAVKEITPEEISKYMQKVIEKHDVKTARDILTEFKADRISTLPKDKYASFIERCEKALA